MDTRIVVIGAGGVGKSALTVRFVQGKFIERYDPTIEDTYRKLVEVDGQATMLDVFDTAGQEDYSSLRDQFIGKGDGFLIVYSITSQSSFEYSSRLRTNILRVKDVEGSFPMVLVANKVDLEDQRQVGQDAGKQLAKKFGCPYVETSAKMDTNTSEAFFALIRTVNEHRKANGYEEGRKKKGGCAII